VNVDYDRIAPRYDTHRRGGGLFLESIVEMARARAARRVLEVGAGTGNNTQSFLQQFPAFVVGLDRSAGMLAHARHKGLTACWVQALAEHLPLAAGSVDFLFGVYMLHYLRDLSPAFSEFARVLGHGTAVFVTAPQDFIERHPMNRYFPSFARIDKARFQPSEQVVEALRGAGFRDAGIQRLADAPRPVGPEYVEKVAAKFISTYDLMPQPEFDDGVRKLRDEVARNGRLAEEIAWEADLIWGIL